MEIEIPEGKVAEWVNGVLAWWMKNQKMSWNASRHFENYRRELGSGHHLVQYETITCRCDALRDDICVYEAPYHCGSA